MSDFNFDSMSPSGQGQGQAHLLPEIVSFATDSRQRTTGVISSSSPSTPSPLAGNRGGAQGLPGGFNTPTNLSKSNHNNNVSGSSGGGKGFVIGQNEKEAKVATTLGSIACSIQHQHERERRVADVNDLRGTISVPVAKKQSHGAVAGDPNHLRHFDRSVSLEVRRLLTTNAGRRSPQRKANQQQGRRPVAAADRQILGGGGGRYRSPSKNSNRGGGSNTPTTAASSRPGTSQRGSTTSSTDVYGTTTYQQQHQYYDQQHQQQEGGEEEDGHQQEQEDIERMLDESSAQFLEALNNSSSSARQQRQQQEEEDEAEVRHLQELVAREGDADDDDDEVATTVAREDKKNVSDLLNSMGKQRREKMALFFNPAFVQPHQSRSTPMLAKKSSNKNVAVRSPTKPQTAPAGVDVHQQLDATRTAALAAHALDAESPVSRRRRRFEMLRAANVAPEKEQVQFKTPAAAQWTYVRTFQSEPPPPAIVAADNGSNESDHDYHHHHHYKRSLLNANKRGGVESTTYPCPQAGAAVEELLHPKHMYRRGSAALMQSPEGKQAIAAVTDECCIVRHPILDDVGNPIGEWPSVTVSGTGFRNGGRRLEAALQRYRVKLEKTAGEYWSKHPSPPRRASLIEKEVARQRRGIFGRGATARSQESPVPSARTSPRGGGGGDKNNNSPSPSPSPNSRPATGRGGSASVVHHPERCEMPRSSHSVPREEEDHLVVAAPMAAEEEQKQQSATEAA